MTDRRPTRDIDLQGRYISNDLNEVLAIVRDIAAITLDDGLVFHADQARVEGIREEDVYSGVRVSLTADLSAARLTLHVDVNVGDPIWPAPQQIVLPRLLRGQIVLAGYPLPMIHAEKIVTAIQRGVANTRWRDFADIYTLARRHDIDAADLSTAIQRVAEHRKARMVTLAQVLDGYAELGQTRWAAWRRRQRLDDRLPVEFAEALVTVKAFADPAIRGDIAEGSWSAAEQAWTAGTR